MDWLAHPNQLIGLLVGVLLALALVTALALSRASAAGLSRRRTRGLVAQLWAALALGLAVLLAARTVVDKPLLSGDTQSGWLVPQLSSAQWGVVGAGLVAAALCLLWAQRTVRLMSGDDRPRPAAPDEKSDDGAGPC